MQAGGFTPAICPAVMAELEDICSTDRLGGKYPAILRNYPRLRRRIIQFGEAFPDPVAVPVCRDPKDDMFIALAVASGAPYLVSGDNDVHAAIVVEYLREAGTEVLTVRRFLDLLEQ